MGSEIFSHFLLVSEVSSWTVNDARRQKPLSPTETFEFRLWFAKVAVCWFIAVINSSKQPSSRLKWSQHTSFWPRFRLKPAQCEKVPVVHQTPRTFRNEYIHSTGETALCMPSSPYDRKSSSWTGWSLFIHVVFYFWLHFRWFFFQSIALNNHPSLRAVMNLIVWLSPFTLRPCVVSSPS